MNFTLGHDNYIIDVVYNTNIIGRLYKNETLVKSDSVEGPETTPNISKIITKLISSFNDEDKNIVWDVFKKKYRRKEEQESHSHLKLVIPEYLITNS